MVHFARWGAAALLGLAVAAATAGAAAADTYLRKGDQDVNVVVKDGLLYCTRLKDNYEMCNGMAKQTDGTWKGRKMKHPDMPGFMRFNGTVTFMKDSLKIQGCALGICQSEIWKKKS